MRKSSKCAFCEEKIIDKDRLFTLKEKIEDWDSSLIRLKGYRGEGTIICIDCLIEFIDNTERVPRTSPQIIYRYVGVEQS